MNFKRKRCRRSIRCSLCTPHRWRGNSKERFKARHDRTWSEQAERAL